MKTNIMKITSLAFKNFFIAVGILLIWRGLWYLFDYIDAKFFADNHLYTAIIGIIIGILILFLPDKDLKELGKL